MLPEIKQADVKKPFNFYTILVAKPSSMITHLVGKHKLLGLEGFDFKSADFEIPAHKFLPECDNSIPSVIHELNNILKLYENQKLVAWTDLRKNKNF